jgi:hypothetical protein
MKMKTETSRAINVAFLSVLLFTSRAARGRRENTARRIGGGSDHAAGT